MATDISEGKVSLLMMKPVNIPMAYIGKALGEAAFRLILLTAPTSAVLLLVYPVSPPPGLLFFAAFLLSLCGSVLLVSSINFIIGSCAIELLSIQGLLRFKFWMQELLSGLLVPLALFPAPLRAISRWLPFEHIGYTPMMIYLGKLSWAETARTLGLEGFWIAFLLLFGNWFWNRLSRRITIHGG